MNEEGDGVRWSGVVIFPEGTTSAGPGVLPFNALKKSL